MTQLFELDKKSLARIIRSELEPLWTDRKATPDVSWVMRMVRDTLCDELLIHCRGNQSRAAKMLGVNRGSYRKYIEHMYARKSD